MAHSIIVFTGKDWEYLKENEAQKTFPTQTEAEDFIKKYPPFGSEYSRTIRQGNWQVVETN